MHSIAFVRRMSMLLALSALLALTLFSGSSVLAAKQSKVTVCHLNADTGVISPVRVSNASSHLGHGDRLYDATLDGATIYAHAWTELDGVAGYSGCDQRIQTLVEASADSTPNAGDRVLYGKYPTALTAPYGFAAFPYASRTIAAYCGIGTAGAVAWYIGELNADDVAIWGPGTRDRAFTNDRDDFNARFSFDVIDDSEAAPYDKNHIRVVIGSATLVNVETVSPTDDPLVDVVINNPC